MPHYIPHDRTKYYIKKKENMSQFNSRFAIERYTLLGPNCLKFQPVFSYRIIN